MMLNKEDGMQITKLKKATLSTVPFDKVRYFSVAEGGAMGSPGEVMMVTSEREVYSANYCYGDISYGDLVAVFPTLGMCEFPLFGVGTVMPEGWNYVALGMGNHLVVYDDVYVEFKKKIKGLRPCEIYQKWLDFAVPKEKTIEFREDLPPNDWKGITETWNKNHPDDPITVEQQLDFIKEKMRKAGVITFYIECEPYFISRNRNKSWSLYKNIDKEHQKLKDFKNIEEVFACEILDGKTLEDILIKGNNAFEFTIWP